MRICIESTFFSGATLPLVKHLSEHNHSVDYFLYAHQGQTEQETLLFDKAIRGRSIIEVSKSNKIYDYLNKTCNIYLIPYYRKKKNYLLKKSVLSLRNQYIVLKAINKIKKNDYDVIYIIIHEKLDFLLCKWLKKLGFKNIIIAYHEVLQRHIGKQELKDVVKKSLCLGKTYVTYSNHTKATLLRFSPNSNIHTIYYGPFETYSLFDTDHQLIKESYILFIGHILPYKGLSFLCDAIDEYGIQPPYKVVIAGDGYDKVLDKIKNDNRFIIINRFLNNSEFANLIRFAKCVVCPYVAGSQSGITHVSLLYGTPLVATKVAAFQEFIEERGKGILVDYGDKRHLSQAIEKALSENHQEAPIPNKLQWKNIICQLEKLFENKKVKASKPLRYKNNCNFKQAPYEAWEKAGLDIVNTNYKLRNLRPLLSILEQFAFKNEKIAIICFAESASLDVDTFPWWGHYEVIPVIWDCWPKFWDYTERWFLRHKVRSAVFTSSQTADEFRRRFPEMNILTITEGIDTSRYQDVKPLRKRGIDFLQYGRVAGLFDSIALGKDVRIVSSKNEKGLLHTQENLICALADSKIVLAVPRSDTQPELTKGVETLTQRYWECMLSGVIMLGRAPRELTELIGYDPVIQIEHENIGEQVKKILSHIDDYQELTDKNRQVALQLADWSIRIKQIMAWLTGHNYEV